jgi:pyruvate dehydrogenase E1 component
MNEDKKQEQTGTDDIEDQEWRDSLEYVIKSRGTQRTTHLLRELETFAYESGVEIPFSANTPYINTIPLSKQPVFPGSIETEKRIRSFIRWNAMSMVVRANRDGSGVGGHISSYASAATLYEVGFNHFFRGTTPEKEGDIVYFQGHAAPGIYGRAYLEGRISQQLLDNFRKELKPGGGLSSYPHPWLMPEFWQFPTVSMGLGPLMAIYQARFNRYLEDRGLKPKSDAKVWAFLGDGETDEPESLGSISLAAREKLDNLIFVINCNLQRLDGPVRGNGNIIQELEANFRGVGWNVIKVIWGGDWDQFFAKDEDGILVKRMNELIDGEVQKYYVEGGTYLRENFWGKYPELAKMVEHFTDEQLGKMRRGGHDAEKVYAAYKAAMEHKGAPTVILARTVKGYGLGEAGEGRNVTHQQKKLNEEELKKFRTRFGMPLSDEEVSDAPFYKPPEESAEMKYLLERRQKLNGFLPRRQVRSKPLEAPGDDFFKEFHTGSGGRQVSTTMVYVSMLTKLLKDKNIGKLIVPIVPDEARTFGMEAFFRQIGIYSHTGQLYQPVDSASLLYYKEAKDGQMLEEGITEAGSMSSFIAAGTAYATHGINMIPFFTYYSMFGFQRIGDLIWAAGDMRCKGFLVGGTAGRTTLAGEGLQHQDGHSLLLAYPVPNLLTYDPAYAYELAVIIQDGIRRMYQEQENIFYYITVMNENYEMPPMPETENIREGILKGMYRFRASKNNSDKKAHLIGSGAILNEVIKAAEILEKDYGVSADIWSITSYKQLQFDAMDAERYNMLHPGEKPKVPYLQSLLENEGGVFVAASDYVQILPDSLARWFPGPLTSLGTFGFGRSESRASLRDFFEVDAKHIALATLTSLLKEKRIGADTVQKAISDLKINPDKLNPLKS